MSNSQPGSEHFNFGEYTTKRRWNSYWHQLDEALAVHPTTCLVVGGGDAIVPRVLREAGVSVTVVDVVDELGPDVVADVRDMPFVDGQFDVVLCCQVLEHIPFESVPEAIRELRRVLRGRLVISLPDQSRTVTFDFRVGNRRLFKRLAIDRKSEWHFNGVHHWELGNRSFPRPAVRSLLEQAFVVDREYLVDENSYHRFFVLTPRIKAPGLVGG